MTTLETTPIENMLETELSTDDITVTAEGFTNLNLSEELLKALSDMGFSTPSGIQAAAIPEIIKGTDIIAKAPTGSGKTAAFAIPLLEKLDTNAENKCIQALVLCPTRELAIQVHREFEKLTKYMENIAVVSVYGGQQIDKQLGALKKRPQIVVATPGRLMDHLRRGSINLERVSMVVLDEADEMLDMGFREDIHTILEDTPENRQTILFSATMAKDIVAITKKFQKIPITIDVTDSLQNAPNIEQQYFEVTEKDKIELLTRLLDLHNVKLGLVFCNTKSNVDKVVEILKTKGYLSDALHGDMNQAQREKVMRGFRNGGVEILVATDVAGRGIDVKNVQAVFNYDLPRDDEDYIHRIGRTARAGESGIALTFVSKRQVQHIRRIEKANGIQIHKKDIPSFEELELARINAYEEKIKTVIQNSDLTEYVQKINSMVSEESSLMNIAATLLKLSMQKENNKINKNIVFESMGDEDDSRKRSRNRSGSRNGRRERNSKFGDNDSSKRRGFASEGRDFRRSYEEFEQKRINETSPESLPEKTAERNSIKDYDRNKGRSKNKGFEKNASFNGGKKSNKKAEKEVMQKPEFSLDEMIMSIKEVEQIRKKSSKEPKKDYRGFGKRNEQKSNKRGANSKSKSYSKKGR